MPKYIASVQWTMEAIIHFEAANQKAARFHLEQNINLPTDGNYVDKSFDVVDLEPEEPTKGEPGKFTVIGIYGNGDRFAHHVYAVDAQHAEEKIVDSGDYPPIDHIAAVLRGHVDVVQ